MSSGDFLAGMRAHRRGDPLDPGAGYEFRRGWRHAEFSAAIPTVAPGFSPSPDPESAPTLDPVNTGPRQ